MNPIERWIEIVLQHNEKAIIPFLQQLNEAQKHHLLPQLSKTVKEYLEIKDRLINNKHFYAKKASLKQERILTYSIFICAVEAEHPLHNWLDPNWLITFFTLENILPWYCPKWLNKYINSFSNQKLLPAGMSYELIVAMLEKNYIQASEALIAKLFSQLIFSNAPNERLVYQYTPEKLGQFPITLNQHIWYIFDHPTAIHHIDRQLNIVDSALLPKDLWYATIQQYEQLGQIDRLRLLAACLTATRKSLFSKAAISWFIGLFDFLKPTKKELIALQEELIIACSTSQAKVVNCILKNLQKISNTSGFNVDNSLIAYDKILSNPTKSVVYNGLVLLERLAKFHPDYQQKIVQFAIQGLAHREEDLQLKAAAIIQAYGQIQQEDLVILIAPYQSNLFQKTIQTLQITNKSTLIQSTDNQLIKNTKKKTLSKHNQILGIQSFTEFKDLALIVFDNKEPYHFDHFLVALLQFQAELKGKNIEALTPVFKRAYQLVFNELPSHQGMLDNILAIFLMDLADLLIRQHPKGSQGLRKLAENYLEQGFFIREKAPPFDLQFAHLYGWYNPYDPSQVYMPIQKLLAKILSFLHEEKPIVLLSTPTHAPTWIDPVVLIKRLAIYQERGLLPDPIDLQLAISRVCFENKTIALKSANTLLTGDYLALIQFLLASNAPFPFPISPIVESTFIKTNAGSIQLSSPMKVKTTSNPTNLATNKAVPTFYYSYITAAITKNNSGIFKQQISIPTLKIDSTYFNGTHDWMIFWEERRFEAWNYKTQKLEFTGEPFIHRELQVKFKKGLTTKHHPNFLYQYFPGNDEAFRPNVNDVQRLLGMLPNNPDPLIALLIADNLKYPNFWEAVAKKRVWEILSWLTKVQPPKYGYAVHLFLATCLLSADKKIRLQAGNIWKVAVPTQQINSALIGQLLGKMERKAFAPLKRFTDLAQQQLFNISTIHNQALEAIIGNLLAKLPAIPVKNTKALLILYRELLASNTSKIINHRLTILLELWTKSASLKKVIRELVVFC